MKEHLARAEKLITIGLAAFALIYLFLISGYPAQAKLIPGIVAVSMLIVAVIQLLGDYLPMFAPLTKGTHEALEEEQLKELEPWQDPVGRRRFFLIAGSTVVLGLLIWLLGFVISIPAFLFVFLLVFDRVSWKVTVFVPVIVGVCAYLIIVRMLELDPFAGFLFRFI